MKKIFLLFALLFPILLFGQTMRQVASGGTAITRLPATSTTTVSATDTIMIFKGGVWKKINSFDFVGGIAPAGWELTGNAAIDSATNFIGTTDAKPFSIWTNGVRRAIWTSNGQVGYGTNPINGFTSSQYGSSISTDTITNVNLITINHDSEFSHRVTHVDINIASTCTVDVNGYSNMVDVNGGKYTKSIDGIMNVVSVNTTDSCKGNVSAFNTITNFYKGIGTNVYGFAGVANIDSGAKIDNLIGNFGAVNILNGSTVGTVAAGLFVPTPINTGTVNIASGMWVNDWSGTGATSGINANLTSIGSNSYWLNQGSLTIGSITAPSKKLDVYGKSLFRDSIQIQDGTQGAAKVLTSDASGTGTWQDAPTTTVVAGSNISITSASNSYTVTNTAPNQTVTLTGAGTTTVSGTYPTYTVTGGGSPSWELAGNALTGSEHSPTEFLGSTNNFDVVFKENNAEVFRLNDGMIGIGTGTTIPTAKINVKGIGTTSATITGLFENSAGTDLLQVRDDGNIIAGDAVDNNLSIGTNNGFGGTAADASVYIGMSCGTSITDGFRNTLLGYNVFPSLTTGDYNIGIGSAGVGTGITTGNDNILIGQIASGNGSRNICMGYQAGNAVTGTDNIFIGYTSGSIKTSGNYNTYLGEGSGLLSTTGSTNTFIGGETGVFTTGSGNIFMGYSAGRNQVAVSNTWILNNHLLSAANEFANGLAWGQHATDSSDQTVQFNAQMTFTRGVGRGMELHAISTPTTAATITLTKNKYTAVDPAGTIAALTINFPDSPYNNDFVEVKFTQIVTAVTYVAGTGGATIRGQINGVLGGYSKWVYDSTTNIWY